MTPDRPAPTLPLALILTVLMTAWWTALAWGDLGALRLPSADAMVRLAQLRDWVDGQGFADLTQARLGPPGGTAMPWSRVADLVPALTIRLLSPLMGSTRAEIAAVMFWPELLFFLHLLLAGAVGRRLGPAASSPAAIALGALAFPALALLMPGRIDHFGLQIVLVEGLVFALLADRLFLAGTAAGLSLLVGMETALPIMVSMVWLGAMWVEDRRAAGPFGVGLLLLAIIGFVALRPDVWPGDRCDGFTPPLLASMLIAGGGWLVLGGLASRLPDRRWRAGAAVALGCLAVASIWIAAPACLASPDGLTDPLLSRIWGNQFDGGLFRQPLGRAISLVGLALSALAVAAVLTRHTAERRPEWLLLLALIGASLAASLLRTDGVWFAAALAAPVLAQLVHAARNRGLAWQAGAVLVSAGLAWQALGSVVTPRADEVAARCTDRDTLAALDRLDAGTFAAPMELSAYLLGRTRHRSLAGPYGRNGAGNHAAAAFFLSTPEEARYQASLWTIDYVALCPGHGGGLPPGLLASRGLAAHLLQGVTPDWLEPVSLVGSDLQVWRVRGSAAPGLRP